MHKRKYMGIMLAFVLVFSSLFSAVGSAEEEKATEAVTEEKESFKDVKGHWAKKQIEKWSALGIVQGSEGNFRPNDLVTRAEFAVIIDRIMLYTNQEAVTLSDVSEQAWYYGAITKLHSAGVLLGNNNKALPLNPITRQEAAVLFQRAFSIEDNAKERPVFQDESEIAGWAKKAIEALVAHKIIQGAPDNKFLPANHLTRAEAITLFDRHIALLVQDKTIDYTGDVKGNVLVNIPDVSLKDMKISGDLIIAQGVGDGDVSLNNVVVEGKLLVQGGGENSILMNNVDVRGALVVNKYNGKVRVLATGSTSVAVTILESGAMLVTKELTGGGFEQVEIAAEVLAGQTITLDGNFTKITNRSEKAAIKATGTIKELVAEAKTEITGDVKVTTVTGTASDNSTVNGKKATGSGTTTPTVPAPGGSGGGNSGGGNGGGNNGGTTPTVAVQSVSIVGDSFAKLALGKKIQLEATVSPANATNKQVTWSVDEAGSEFVEVSSTGLVTPKKLGTATVTVKTVDGGHTASVKLEVTKPELNFTLSPINAEQLAEAGVELDEVAVANSAKLKIGDVKPIFGEENNFYTVLTETASDPINESDFKPATVYLMLGVTSDFETLVVLDIERELKVQGSLELERFEVQGILDNQILLKIMLPLRSKVNRNIQNFQVTIDNDSYQAAVLDFSFYEYNAPLLTGIDDITGTNKKGEVLTAGKLNTRGKDLIEYELTHVGYEWYRSDQPDGKYEKIDTGTIISATYQLTEADEGKYIKVHSFGDRAVVGGFVTSAAFGPVEVSVKAKDVFQEITKNYLNNNKDAFNVTTDLLLSTKQDLFPNVDIKWQSSSEDVISNSGKVTRPEGDDVEVTLTVTLSGEVEGKKEFSVLVRSKAIDDVEIGGFIDPYFADGYPQAYVKEGNIHVKLQLNQAAEVFMVVNASNGTEESSVQSIIAGHAGKQEGEIVWANSSPYINVTEDMVGETIDLNTNLEIGFYSNLQSIRIEFVIVDNVSDKNYISKESTTIIIDPKAVEALDTSAPWLDSIHVSKDHNKLYLVYMKELDQNSQPLLTDYIINEGAIKATAIEMGRYSEPEGNGGYPSLNDYVVLTLSNKLSEEEILGLVVDYQGVSLQDTTDAHNKVRKSKSGQWELKYGEERITKAYLGPERRQLSIAVSSSFNNNLRTDKRVSIQVDVDGKKEVQQEIYSYFASSSENTYNLTLDKPLPAGKVTIKLIFDGFRNWTYDNYPEQIVTDEVVELTAPGKPISAVYKDNKMETDTYNRHTIEVAFAERSMMTQYGHSAYSTLIIDGKEYKLRGHIVRTSYEEKNKLVIVLTNNYHDHVIKAIEAGKDIQLKYSGDHMRDFWGQGAWFDFSGNKIENFSIIVTKEEDL